MFTIDKKRLLYILIMLLLVIALVVFLGMMKKNGSSNPYETLEPVIADDFTFESNTTEEVAKLETKSDFFAEYRMERERLRGKQLELLKGIINNEASEEKARTAASLRIVEITSEMEKEMQAENIVKSKGYKDCVIILQPEATTIIVLTENLTISEEKELRDLVSKITEASPDKMSIIVRTTG